MRAVRFIGRLLFGQPSSRVGVLDNPQEDNLSPQNIPGPLENSSASQESLDLLLITAVKNPRGEAQDENGLTQTVAELLARGANVNAVTPYGDTALILAAENGHKEIVSALLSHGGIDVNAATSKGSTALMSAAYNGHTGIVSALLSCEGIDINAVTSNGDTALMSAAYGRL